MAYSDNVSEQRSSTGFTIIRSSYSENKLLFLFYLIVILLFFPTASAHAAPQQNTSKSPGGLNSTAYKIGVGDVLDVNVYEVPAASRTVTVRSDGRISLPLAGEFTATGITPADLAKNISEKLTKFIDTPSVTVILNHSAAEVFYIVGQIARPGQYPITQPITVLQAIATAGGFQEWAKKSRIMIVSAPGKSGKSKKIKYFNYEDFLGGDATGNVLIESGDTIVVP